MAIDHRILQGVGVKSNQSILDIFNTALDFQRDKPFREQRLSKAQQDNALLGVSIKQAQHDLDEDKKESGDRDSERGRQEARRPREDVLSRQELANKTAEAYANSLSPSLEAGNSEAAVAVMKNNLKRLNEINSTLPPERRISVRGIEEDIIQAQTPEGLEQLRGEVNSTLGIKPNKPAAGFTLGQGEQRFGAAGELVASVAPKPEKPIATVAPIPEVLLDGLTEGVASKGSAAYTAAGGGKDGLAAFTKVVDKSTEQERRIASPKLLKQSFPQATPAESRQLQSAMDGAKNTEQGLKAAGKVRAEQRRTKKAKVFQKRAVELIDKILSNPELGDVLGSLEGSLDFRLQDSESELISDIEEAQNILTADNLDLMTGVLSETDIKIIANLAGGALNRERSEKRFRSDAGTLRDKLSSQEVLTVDEISNAHSKLDSDLQSISDKELEARIERLKGG